jgi:hypothetical protein
MLVVHPADAPGQYAVQLAACWTPFPFESPHHLALVPPVAPQILAVAAVVVRQNLHPVFAQSCRRVLQVGPECSRNHHRQRTMLEHSGPSHRVDIQNLQGQQGRQTRALESTQSRELVRPVQDLVSNRTKSRHHLRRSVHRQKDRAPCSSVHTVEWGQELSAQTGMLAVVQTEELLASGQKAQNQRRVLKSLELGCLQN